MSWKVKFTRKAYKQLAKQPNMVRDLADAAVHALEQEGPVPKYWNVKKLGTLQYRLRLNYRYRIKYVVMKQKLVIEIFYIGHRKNAYRTS